MHLLVPLASLLGIEIEAMTEQIKRTIIVNAVMVMLLLVGLLFLSAAGFFALADRVGPVYAALSFAGVSLLLAFGLFVASRAIRLRRRRLVAERRRSTEAGALATTAAMTALPALVKSPLLRTIALPAAAAAVAFLATRQFRRPNRGA
jgi:arginine exporter protein ArgO